MIFNLAFIKLHTSSSKKLFYSIKSLKTCFYDKSYKYSNKSRRSISRRRKIFISFSFLHKEYADRCRARKPRCAPQQSFSRLSTRLSKAPTNTSQACNSCDEAARSRRHSATKIPGAIQQMRRAKRTSLTSPSVLAQFSLPPRGKPPVATFWSAFTLTIYSETFLRSIISSIKYNLAMLHFWFM